MFLKNLEPQIQYLYTVRDCIGCMESKVDTVKSIIEQTSLDLWVKLKLKVDETFRGGCENITSTFIIPISYITHVLFYCKD